MSDDHEQDVKSDVMKAFEASASRAVKRTAHKREKSAAEAARDEFLGGMYDRAKAIADSWGMSAEDAVKRAFEESK